MDTPGAQISTGRTEDGDGGRPPQTATHAARHRRTDTCHGILEPLEAPGAPESSLAFKQTGWVKGHGGEREREGTREGSRPLSLCLQDLALRWEKDAIPATPTL